MYSKLWQRIGMHPWWHFCKDHPHMTRKVSAVVSVLCGVQPKGMQFNFNGSPCGICGEHAREDAGHVLFDCAALAGARRVRWERLLASVPPPMAQDLDEMLTTERTELMLSGPGKLYIADWGHIYVAFAEYVYGMYMQRCDMYNGTKI